MPADGRGVVSALRTHLGTLAGTAVLAVLVWRLGTGAFLDGLRRIDAPTVLAALGIGLVTTVFSAWRWALVARGLRIRLPLGGAVADYYRALFLNAALPGGVLGDVHRAVRHGQSAGDLGRGVRAVVLERAAGQVALMGAGGAVLLTMPSPVLTGARRLAPLVALALLGALAVVLALRMNRTPEEPTLPRQALPRRALPRRTLARRALPRRTPARRTPARRAPALRAVLGEAREGLLSRRNLPGVAGSSVVVLAGHLAMFVLAARVVGSGASVAALTPLAVLALLAMGLPLNVGGWGPREGVTAWAFGAAGLGAGTGLGVAVVYGVLSLAASLPGAVVLVARRRTVRYARSSSDTVTVTAVSSAKHSAKESARLASSSFPFSADPSEGRPMTPEAV
ncbi:lysylphosphatidylglycerol synthase transmembrane domain-containing protein [Streptomyces coelicoflavus]|uniref:lysylphosphatidylglycerol synthase transmembrane domain-containing protein n=1 Tax=Streptomyces coelicoflavus TaxID=285562 RepID=UPI003B97FCE3